MEAPPAHRNAPSEHSGVPHGFFRLRQRTALSPPKRSCFRFASLTLRLRTEMLLRNIPVFRSAFSAPTAHRAVSSKTLMLQVRFARPPVGGGSSALPLLRTITPCGALVFRSAYWLRQTLDLQVRFAHPPVGGGSFTPPCTPLSCPRKCGDRRAAIPLCGKSSLSEHAMDFPSALHIPKEAWSFLRTPPRPAAKRAAATRAATPLPPPASSFFLTARSSFRTSRRP